MTEAIRADGAPWVLVVDDDTPLREAAAYALSEAGYRVRTAADAAHALEEAALRPFEAMLLDVELGSSDGFALHEQLSATGAITNTAVLFMSSHRHDEEAAVKALEGGACDYLRRPFGLAELRARLAAAISARRTIAELRRLGNVDSLTGLMNRGAFFEALERERRRAQRENAPLALVVIDVDRFKAVNDEHGHAAGDAALRAVAEVFLRSCRSTDIAGRIGGEEFAIALPSTDGAGVVAFAEKLRLSIAELAIPVFDTALTLTASFGTAWERGERLDGADSALMLLGKADSALYRAKRAGRDRVEAA